MKKSIAPCLAAAVLATAAVSRATPAGDSVFADFSLWSPSVQSAEPTDSVNAFRLAFYGENADVTGFDLNVVGFTHGDFVGFQWGFLFDRIDGDVRGVQFGFPVGVSWIKGGLWGLDAGLVNVIGGEAHGAVGGLWNSVGAEMTGVQVGFVNYAATLNGLQVGLVNVATGGYGLQIGLVNYLSGSEVFDVLPIANFRF